MPSAPLFRISTHRLVLRQIVSTRYIAPRNAVPHAEQGRSNKESRNVRQDRATPLSSFELK